MAVLVLFVSVSLRVGTAVHLANTGAGRQSERAGAGAQGTPRCGPRSASALATCIGHCEAGRRRGQGEARRFTWSGRNGGATAVCTGRSFVLELSVEVFSLILLQVDELLSFFGVACVVVLFALDHVSTLADVVTNSHFLGASS